MPSTAFRISGRRAVPGGVKPRPVLLFFLLLLASCSRIPGAVPTPTATDPPTSGPTATASPSPTATPTRIPTEVPLPTPSPTPTPAAIGQENAPDLRPALSAGVGSIGELALSPDGRTIAAAGSVGVWLFDKFSLETRHQLGPNLGAALTVAWSPDGSRLATGWFDGSVRIWEWSGGADAPVQTAVLVGHTAAVRALDWSPDGTLIASGGEDRAIRVWDAANTTNAFSFFHTSAIHSVDWHPESALLLVGEFDGSISVLNGRDGSTAASFFAHDGWVDVVRWSPDGTRILSAGLDRQLVFWETDPQFDGTIDFEQDLVIPTLYSIATAFWTPGGAQVAVAGGAPYRVEFFDAAPASGEEDLRTAVRSLEGHAGPIEGLVPAPGGVLITSAQDNTLRVWDLASGGELRQLSALNGPAFTGALVGAVWSPAGDRFATAGADGTLRVWDPETGAPVWQAEVHIGGATGVTWSSTGAWIATGGTDNFTRIWDAGSGELVQELRSEGGRVNAVAFAPFGNQLAAGGFFRIAQVWEAGTDQSPILLYPDVEITALGWSSSATLLAIGGSDGSVHLYNVPAVAEIGVFTEEHNTPIAAIAWEPGGGLVAAIDRRGTIAIWDNVSGELIARHEGDGGVWNGLAWSPQGVLAAGSDNGTVLFLDAATLEPLALKAGHSAGVAGVALSPDGRSLGTVDSNGLIVFWDLSVGEVEPLALTPPETGEPGAMPALAWPPAGPITQTNAIEVDQLAVIGRGTASVYDATADYVAVGGSTGVWIYDRATREPVRYLEGGRTFGAALSPDGRFLATRELQLIRVWDLERAVLLRAIPAGLGTQDALAWSPDGSLFAAGERGGQVTVFNFRSGAAVHAWETGAEVVKLDWSPGGRLLAAASGTDIWLWDVPAGEQVALLVGHEDVVRAIDFHSTEALLLSGGDDPALRIWELDSIVVPVEEEGEEEIEWPEVESDALTSPSFEKVVDLAWEPGGQTFLSTHDCCQIFTWGESTREIQGSVKLEAKWEVDLTLFDDGSGSLPWIGQDEGHYSAIETIIWVPIDKPDTSYFVFTADDQVQSPPVIAETVDLTDLQVIPLFEIDRLHGGFLNLIPGPNLAYRLDINQIVLYEAVEQTLIQRVLVLPLSDFELDNWIGRLSSTGSRLLWTNTDIEPLTLHILDLLTSTSEFILLTEIEESDEPSVSIADLAWSPDATDIAIGLSSGELWVVDSVSGAIRFQAGVYELGLNAIAWSPDGSMIAVAGSDGDANGGQQFIRLVNAVSGGVVRELAIDFGRTAQALAFSPDGTLLVSGDSGGGVQIWDAATGELLADLRGHTLAVTGVAFAPDGKAFATSSRDGTVRVWGIP